MCKLNTCFEYCAEILTKSSYCLLTLLRRSAAFAMVYSTVLHVHVAVLKSQNNCPRMEHSQLKLKAYEWWHSGSPQLYPPMLPGSLFLFRRESLWTRLHGIMEHLEQPHMVSCSVSPQSVYLQIQISSSRSLTCWYPCSWDLCYWKERRFCSMFSKWTVVK